MDSRNKIDQMTKIKLLSIHNYDSRSSFDTVTQVICLFTFTRGQSPRDSEKNKSHHVVSHGEKSLYWTYMLLGLSVKWLKSDPLSRVENIRRHGRHASGRLQLCEHLLLEVNEARN